MSKKVCWNKKTNMLCRNLGISMDEKNSKCAAKGSRKLIDEQGDKKTHYKDHCFGPSAEILQRLDGEYFTNIVCPEGCDCQELYNLREHNLL